MFTRKVRNKHVLMAMGLVAIVSLFASMATAGGQAELASLRGRVLDANGVPVQDAVVILTDLSRGGEVQTETNDKGSFYRRGLRPSAYSLRIEKDGYMAHNEELSFRAGEEKRQEFQLVPALSSAEVAFQEGIAAFNAEDFESAAQAFEEVIRAAPEAAEGHTNLALAYIQLGRMDEAIQELEKSAELSADFRTWAQLAIAYLQVDRLQAATRSFETALEKEHDPSDPIVYECWMALGSLYFGDNRVPDAVTAYENALSANPDSVEALVALGKCQFNLQDLEKAREYFQRTVDADPSSEQAEEARTFLEEIAKAAPPRP